MGEAGEVKENTGATIESYESRTAHFLYRRLQGEQLSLQHSVFATTLAGWCIGQPERHDPSIRRPHRDTRSVAFPLKEYPYHF